jgi:tetratricopeptide (TPR) repeat protein
VTDDAAVDLDEARWLGLDLDLVGPRPEGPAAGAAARPTLADRLPGSQQAMDAINRAIELMVESSASASESSALLSLFYQVDYFIAQSNIAEALVWLERLLDRAKLSQERIYHVMANTMAGEVYLFSGQPARAIEYIEEAISEYQPEDHDLLIEISGHNIWNRCRICYGWAHWLLGNGQQVEIVREQLINEARRQSKNSELSLILVYMGALLSALQLEPEQAEAYAQASISASKDGHAMVKIMGETVLGWAQICKGEWEQGIALVENGIAGWRASGALSTLPMGQILLADSLSRIGRTQESLDILDSLKDMIAKTGQRTFAAIIFWLEGEILARELQRNEQRLDSQWTPVHSFLQAIEIAREQQAREIELRASVSLAHYYRNQGQAGEAAAQLEAVLSSFNPGMNTRLLQAAKQLLTGLASNPSLNETPGSA